MSNQYNQQEKKGESSDKVKSLLSGISKKGRRKKETAIYGIYDNRNASLFTKINDFLKILAIFLRFF